MGICLAVSGAVGGDAGIPRGAGGDNGVQVSEDPRGDHALRLRRGELVVLPCGQVAIAGRRRRGWPFGRPTPCAMRPAEARSNLAGLRRPVRASCPPSRSQMTVIAATHVFDRNGCRAVSNAAGHTLQQCRIC